MELILVVIFWLKQFFDHFSLKPTLSLFQRVVLHHLLHVFGIVRNLRQIGAYPHEFAFLIKVPLLFENIPGVRLLIVLKFGLVHAFCEEVIFNLYPIMLLFQILGDVFRNGVVLRVLFHIVDKIHLFLNSHQVVILS